MLVSVFTVAMHNFFFNEQFISNGHLFIPLQLNDASTYFSVLISVIFIWWLLIICSMFLGF